MSHAIYQTKALILKTKNMRESNKLVYLYTEKFGLLYASVQSIRELKSKMRYHLHPYSLVEVDLVSGRNIWRLTGIHEIESSFTFVHSPFYSLISLISDTLIRLCAGEEKNQILWNELMLFLHKMKIARKEYISEYEIIIVIRILSSLGYWNSDNFIVLKDDPYDTDVLDYVYQHKSEYIRKINESLTESQL